MVISGWNCDLFQLTRSITIVAVFRCFHPFPNKLGSFYSCNGNIGSWVIGFTSYITLRSAQKHMDRIRCFHHIPLVTSFALGILDSCRSCWIYIFHFLTKVCNYAWNRMSSLVSSHLWPTMLLDVGSWLIGLIDISELLPSITGVIHCFYHFLLDLAIPIVMRMLNLVRSGWNCAFYLKERSKHVRSWFHCFTSHYWPTWCTPLL